MYKCTCEDGWKGQYCEQLDLLPASLAAGLNLLNPEGGFTSTWGGPVVYAEGQYHMFAAEMEYSCGINSWLQNSVIVHATLPHDADLASTAFQRQGVLFPIFSHEPKPVVDPRTGEMAVFFTHGCVLV